MTPVELAPAKINLALHVTGQRSDGYHLLDSLVVFADFGDRLQIAPSDEMAIRVSGPLAKGVPTDGCNLAWRAAALFDQPVRIDLQKHLPAEAGIGGGSADAAAVIRAMVGLTEQGIDTAALSQLGADVPVCVQGKAARMRGIGDQLDAVPHCPAFHAVMVNCGVRLSTPAVFRALDRRDNAPMDDPPQTAHRAVWLDWLQQARNDLQAPAILLAPVIQNALAAIADQSGCLLARMSGSGATCFGLYADAQLAQSAASAILAAHPEWWVRPCVLNLGGGITDPS